MRNCALLILLFAAACGSDQSAHRPVEVSPAPAPTETDISDEQVPSAEEKMEEIPESTAPPVASNAAADNTASAAPLPRSANNINSTVPATDRGFTDLAKMDASIKLDIKYATADNFTKSKIYDCPRCLLRPEAAEAVIKAHKALKKNGMGLKVFDCYRPRPYQQRLWDKVPNPDYVTPPVKGSMHSRGAAVDLTIVDANGKELDMGTAYDFFGREAHTDNYNLPQKVLTNRRLLRETMAAVGFKGIRTEWWHFSYQSKVWPLSDYVWPCDN